MTTKERLVLQKEILGGRAPIMMTVMSSVNLKDVAERERGEQQLLLVVANENDDWSKKNRRQVGTRIPKFHVDENDPNLEQLKNLPFNSTRK